MPNPFKQERTTKKDKPMKWVEINNESEDVILIHKYRYLANVKVTRHMLHPTEQKIISHGTTWTSKFSIKLFST